MLDEDDLKCTEDDTRSSIRCLSSFIFGGRKDDVEFFRMDSPSQLENEYNIGAKLGEGTFGVVYAGIRKRDDVPCAIKKILREKNYSASERARLNREISILRLVRHPSIIELYAVAESPTYLFLITELCDGNTLSHYLELPSGRRGFDEIVVIDIIRQVASAVSYLHNRGIIHRDLKAGNIMLLYKSDLFNLKQFRSASSLPRSELERRISSSCGLIADAFLSPHSKQKLNCPFPSTSPFLSDQQQNVRDEVNNRSRPVKLNSSPLPIDGGSIQKVPSSGSRAVVYRNSLKSTSSTSSQLRVKLIDFGLAIEVRKNEEILDNPCGTPLYMAPEVLNGRSYTRQCDVWSLGVLMFQLLTGQFPFCAQNESRLLELMNTFDMKFVTRRHTNLSELAQNCLLRLLHPDPAYRYSAAELLLDPWISNESQQFPDEEPATPRNAMIDGLTVLSRPASMVTDASLLSTNLRSSTSGRQASGTFSSTNVLELMKQYHKEMVTNKQDLNDDSKASEY